MNTTSKLAECDLVMKGGIASGVVYPKAVTRLAQDYRFVNLGGTSAGAIAAGLTAAAEYARQTGSGDGFAVLDTLPDDIGKRLLSLFQPAPAHKKLFNNIVRFMATDKKSPVWFAIKNIFTLKKSLKALPDTYFGFCTGMTMGKPDAPGLTDWLNHWIERTAARLVDNDLPAQPLTFGMLKKAGINLRTVTTNLSQQTPVTLPAAGFLLARRSDMNKLLPGNVVQYIVSKQAELAALRDKKDLEGVTDAYVILPTGDDMPVLLAVRLSLSFPLLLSAFPLYKSDWSLRLCPQQQRTPRVCWFSDGGIASNFPIHLFDSALPARPTFGISLGEFNDCRQEEDPRDGSLANRVYLPMGANQGMTLAVNEVKGVFGFVAAIFTSAQNWQDAAQTVLPGYRERVVRLSLKPDEGGLNLSMTPKQIQALTRIGETAGERICATFDIDEHRWRRVLSAYAAIETALEALVHDYDDATPESMEKFLARYRAGMQSGDWVASSYKPKNLDEFDACKNNLDQLMAIARQWSDKPLRDNWGTGNMPRPSSVLKIAPQRFSG